MSRRLALLSSVWLLIIALITTVMPGYAAIPTITSFAPTHGNAGDVVTITGTAFTGATHVQFDGFEASFSVVSATSIKATVPLAATTGKIIVNTPDGMVTSSGSFTRDSPKINSFTPTNSEIGRNVVIQGTGFTEATSCEFNGVDASFSVESDTTIVAVVPDMASKGKIKVTTPYGTTVSATDFTVDGLIGLKVTLDPGAGYTGAFNRISLKYSLVGPQTYTGTLVFDDTGNALINQIRPGVYDLSLTGSHWLQRVITGINVDGVNSVHTSLANGDADGGNSVDLFDFVVLDSKFGSANTMADLDGDGQVNLFDYVIIDRSFSAQGDTLVPPEPKVLGTKAASISATGGTVTPPVAFPDSPTVTIPAGAFNGSGVVKISVLDRAPVPPANPGTVLVGNPVRVDITGAGFTEGATVRLSAPVTLGADEQAFIGYEKDGIWIAVEPTISGGVVSGDVPVFAPEAANGVSALAVVPEEMVAGVYKYVLKRNLDDPYMQTYKFNGVKWVKYYERWKETNSKRVALMVHGIAFGNPDDLKPLATHLWQKNMYDEIYAVEYTEGYGISRLGKKLAEYINGKVVTGQIDIYAHSMGGVVARSAIEMHGAYPKVHLFVSMSSPHLGNTTAFLAALVLNNILGKGYQPEYTDLKVTSTFMEELNKTSGKNNCHYRSIVGTSPTGGSTYLLTLPIWPVMLQPHDGMVETFSSRYFLDPECADYKREEIPFNHDWVKRSEKTYEVVDRWYKEEYSQSGGGATFGTKINPIDGAEMVWVPAGEFLRGSNIGRGEESPQRQIYLDGYWMYKYEVTVAQYRAFCQATNRSMPAAPYWGWLDTHPMLNVSWYDSTDYARWAGVSLPTEAQWEKAARGTDGREYPWGNVWNESKCANYYNSYVVSPTGTKPVGSYPSGVSPYGCMDMAGNAWEWCADWFYENYYQVATYRNPLGPATSPYGARVLRGGSWDRTYDLNFRCAYRGSLDPAQRGRELLGFRCARTE